MLETYHFSSNYEFQFGALSRDYGYEPRVNKDIADWYRSILDFLMIAVRTNGSDVSQIKQIIASNFRGVWARGRINDQLEAAVIEIGNHGFWREGWLAVKQARKF